MNVHHNLFSRKKNVCCYVTNHLSFGKYIVHSSVIIFNLPQFLFLIQNSPLLLIRTISRKTRLRNIIRFGNHRSETFAVFTSVHLMIRQSKLYDLPHVYRTICFLKKLFIIVIAACSIHRIGMKEREVTNAPSVTGSPIPDDL